MFQFKVKAQLFIISLIYLSSEYKKLISESHKLAQEEEESFRYLFFSCANKKANKNGIKVEYPLNFFSIIRIDPSRFWDIFLQDDTFDLITDNISEMLDKNPKVERDKKVFIFKSDNAVGKFQFGKIFTNKEKLVNEKVSNLNDKPKETELPSHERIQEYLSLNFPHKNIDAHDIFINKSLIFIHCIYLLHEHSGTSDFNIDFYFDITIKKISNEGLSSINKESSSLNYFFFEESLSKSLMDSFKPQSFIFKLTLSMVASITIDVLEGGEKKITWKFLKLKDKGLFGGSNEFYGVDLGYGYHTERASKKGCARSTDYMLVWRSLNPKNNNFHKNVEITEKHFKDWILNEENIIIAPSSIAKVK